MGGKKQAEMHNDDTKKMMGEMKYHHCDRELEELS